MSTTDIIPEFLDLVLTLEPILPANKIQTALDVGSRDALVALLLKTRYPHANVFAFECNPDALKLCRKNIAKRPITLVEKAASDTTGTLDFFSIDPKLTKTPHADGNIGASSLYRANPEYPHETYVQNKITVPSTRLDDWAQQNHIPAIDLLWMDVQGAALSVLKGLTSPTKNLLASVKAVYVELEYKPMYIGQPLANETRAFLALHDILPYKKFYADDWFGNELFIHKDWLPSTNKS